MILRKPVPGASLDTIWEEDLLGRRAEAEFLIRFLVSKIKERKRRGGRPRYVLNIDAAWGQGKTFFLEKLAETLRLEGYAVATVNSWKDDHAEDAFIAVMSAIRCALGQNSKMGTAAKASLGKLTSIGGRVVAAPAKGASKQLVTKYLGDDALELMKSIVGDAAADAAKGATEEVGKTIDEFYDAEGKALFEKFDRAKESIEKFKSQLQNVASSLSKSPFFVLVDELDRCRPTYAVELLERIKHLFDVDGLVFVIATDSDQLKCSIKALYGGDFDAGRYLLRFFDQTFSFATPSVAAFVAANFYDIDQSKLYGTQNEPPAVFTSRTFQAFGLALRDIEQCLDILANCVTAWDQPAPLILLVLLPLIVAQHKKISVEADPSVVKPHLKAIVPWKVDFHIFDRNGQRIMDGWETSRLVHAAAQQLSLPQILAERNTERRSPEDQLLTLIFANELSLRFPQGYMSNNPPSSLVRHYPNLVRSVGRLTPSKPL